VLIAPTEREVRAVARQIASLPPSQRGEPRRDVLAALNSDDGRPLSATVDDWLVGTPESVCEQLQAYTRLGISHFMLWFLDYPSLDGMHLFAERVPQP
jgi:alkanesulfonate monooxygenase SsuD/methylene tetrahydromethanopterin reductase-like flavin-dependent oxidoreductase (luciferase family)